MELQSPSLFGGSDKRQMSVWMAETGRIKCYNYVILAYYALNKPPKC